MSKYKVHFRIESNNRFACGIKKIPRDWSYYKKDITCKKCLDASGRSAE